MATRFGMQESEADIYLSEINEAESDFNAAQSELDRLSQIESFAQHIYAYLEAFDFENADDVLAKLASIESIPRSIYKEIDIAYGKAYFRQSELSYKKLDIQSAITWLEKAVSSSPDGQNYSKVKSKYRVVKSILDARLKNVSLAKKLKQSAMRMFPEDAVISGIKIGTGNVVSTATGNETSLVKQSKHKLVTHSNSVACTASMAGKGSVFTCRDELSTSFFGPYLVVLPASNAKVLAMTKYEIRIGEYNYYCTATNNCNSLPGDDLLPVTGVSIAQINSYAKWMSHVTGGVYRLPTISEWRYAAKADNQRPKFVNCITGDYVAKIQHVNYKKSQTSNSWGLSNYLGNVQEIATVRSGHVALGGHYRDDISKCTNQFSRLMSNEVDNVTGFRLVKEL